MGNDIEDIQDVFIHNLDSIKTKRLPKHVIKTALDISHCRTNAMHGHLYQCPTKHFSIFLRNSCNNRLCPKCQDRNKIEWNQKCKNLVLNCSHYHLVFKLPTFRYEHVTTHYKEFINILFASAKKTIDKIIDFSFDEDITTGSIIVLHTHGNLLQLHPHLHVVISDGGLNQSNTKWINSNRNLFNWSDFNSIYNTYLKKELSNFYSKNNDLSSDFYNSIQSIHKSICFFSEKYESPYHWVDYLTKTIKGSSIQNRNISFTDGALSINVYDQSTKFSQDEFIRRFLLHVLPTGTKSIRYYGLYSVKSKDRLSIAKSIQEKEHILNIQDDIHPDLIDENSEFLPYKFCPVCKKRMILVEKTLPYQTPIYILNRFGKDPPGLDFFHKIAA
ncbi:transposase [Leptospira ognonensis]|uniref:Transposase n=1 Tax=Leptospira ognonensis TaxID=2484945 RepID=A0A4R9JVB5_9LEPT|nr:transposase [Leptospira ognonensis]TGL55467.1 transposase [Leptospira ognonensis]